MITDKPPAFVIRRNAKDPIVDEGANSIMDASLRCQ